MLKPIRIADTAAANQLIKLWAARYMPDLSILPAEKGQFPITTLVECISKAGRAHTVDRVKRLLRLNCEMAGLEANSLFSYIPNIVNLAEARYLAGYVEQVYEAVLEAYLEQPPPNRYLQFIDASSTLFSKLALPSLLLPTITRLADTLEPILLQLQNTYLNSGDRRTIGFLTTQFHFSTREVLKQLTPCEQVLLTPYFKFVEEQVCIPWQRVCAAGSRHLASSPELMLVEQLLSNSQQIAEQVYDQTTLQYGHTCSRRGTFTNSNIAASTIRDLIMFQGYLWLCVLENSMVAIEEELLPLCQTVFPAIGVRWDLVEYAIQLLTDEIHSRLNTTQLSLLSPYTQALRVIFSQTEHAKTSSR